MATGIRAVMGIASLILTAVALIFMLWVILSGVTDHTPLNRTWFLEADTSNIAGTDRPTSRWTYFFICGDSNKNCGSAVPALPIGYAWRGGSEGAPASLVGKHGHQTTSTYYFYMWRFGWVFYLIAFVFTALGFLTSLVAPCSRLASGVSGFIISLAFLFMAIATPMMTAVFVKARDHFHHEGRRAKVGPMAFGFSWAALTALFLAMMMLFLGCGLGGSRRDKSSGGGAVTTTTRSPRGHAAKGGRGDNNISFWRRQRARKGQRSFGEGDSQRRVRDEYA